MTRRWLVTGCSSGLGHALAAAAAQAGHHVAATARDPRSLAPLVDAWPEHITPLALDVRDPEQCAAAVTAAETRLGGIDVLVNNAGGGLFGAVEEVGDDELRDQLETLVTGPWRLIRLTLPGMRARGSGHIVNLSTIGARAPVPGLAAYLSGKQALEAMSLALAAETAPFGIRVTVLEPGPYATNYGKAMAETAAKLPAYSAVADVLGMFRGLADNPYSGDPGHYARTVLRLIETETPTPLRIPIGPMAADMLAEALDAARTELEAAQALTRDAATGHTPPATPTPPTEPTLADAHATAPADTPANTPAAPLT
jgi:NAD(P)-dependent dehydrogenase (short-subunit alcohol dehydrogenase family)